MSADIIQAQYDQLEALARRFGKQADLQIALQKRVQTNATRLRTAWVGRGSDAFFAEMDGKVFPAMQRLIAALREADRVTRQMSELVHQAEDEASRLFSNRGGAEASPELTDPKAAPIHDSSRDRPILWGLFTDKYYYTPTFREYSGTISADGISPNDVGQGALGDCYFMAALSSIAQQHPDVIWNAIEDNGDGTYTVTFHQDGKPVQVTVDSDFPVREDSNGNATDILAYARTGSRADELWPMIMEKAYAQLDGNSYARIEGGWPGDAVELITGKPVQRLDLDASTPAETQTRLNDLQDRLNAGEYLTVSTRSTGPFENKGMWPTDIAPLHAYSIEQVDVEQELIYLHNPWGSAHNPRPLTLDEFSKYFIYAAANR